MVLKLKRKHSSKDAPNLKRFRASVEEYAQQHGSEAVKSKDNTQFSQKRGKPRKVRRKEERKLKKQKIHAFKQHKPFVDHEKEKQKQREEKKKLDKERSRKEKNEKRKRDRQKKKEKVKEEKIGVRELGLQEANKQEDKIIKQLEKQLKLNKRKKKSLPQSFVNDGLDYILEAVDKEKLKSAFENNDYDESDLSDTDLGLEDLGSEGEEEEDYSASEDSDVAREEIIAHLKKNPEKGILATIKEKKKAVNSDKKSVKFSSTVNDEEDESEDGDELEGDETDGSGSDENGDLDEEEEDSDGSDIEEDLLPKQKRKNNEESSEEEEDLDGIEENEDYSEEENEDEDETEPKLKEDIYGRLVDNTGKLVGSSQSQGAYVPPAKRLAMASSQDEKKRIEMERMKKQLKGLVNRLSEANIKPISSQVEEMYRSKSRAYLTEALMSIITEATISPTLTPERLVMEQVMMVAILHGNVGSEIGATFLQSLAKRFDKLFNEEIISGNKEVENILVFLAHMYNLKVIHSLIIFDILQKLANRFEEKDIELILVLLKSVGFSLRKDDPARLRDLIVEIQNKAATVDTSHFKDQSRLKFILEILMAIKNNNMRKIPNYDPSHIEHLRKMLRTYVTSSASGDNQLRITLDDLLLAEERGKWWLVGSAWSGRQAENKDSVSSQTATSVMNDVSDHILDLARKQRMNTDVRKNIFCIIMTCEDFVDAFEKLLRLGFKHQQEREIIHVIIDLCLQEKTSNPFYSYLAQKFCEYHRRFQMTIQFNVWDKFKEMDEFTSQKTTNLAKFLAHLIATKACSLSIFKVLEFAELDKPKVQLLRKTLKILLEDHPEYTVQEMFTRIAPLPKLHMLREGLKLFMQHFLIRDKGKVVTVDDVLKERIKLAEKCLGAAETKMRL